ncbi:MULTISPECIES: DUF1826 domain-containing protein [unclassified Ruegeria]|uniref:DUF1826 domain-containing protein n=1 Tax=unclassified Ruegeria TaxID=2625375 RepID=UPI001489761B|nr:MULTISPECIES: DUF1826 domain-containing protein [unclassified Ruegeria]
MSVAYAEIKNHSEAVHFAKAADGLSALHDPQCAAAIWNRPLPQGFQNWIDGLDPDQLPATRTVLRPDVIRQAVSYLCDGAAMELCAERDWLISDIADLSQRFATIMGAPYLRLRLGVITTNACCKFHIDAIKARLICTYRGTATQYGFAQDGVDPRDVATVPTGSPMVMRGTLWPENPVSNLKHRSPPIAGTGETRLVLVLDLIFDLEEDLG